MSPTENAAELWTTEQVAEHFGIDPTSVRKTMSRRGVEVYDREPGKGGQNRYLAEPVREAKKQAPGKGNRTPRKPTA